MKLFTTIPAAIFTAILLLVVHFLTSQDIEAPIKDALRYADYALNLADESTFGLKIEHAPVQPGRANAPLYPAFVAAVLLVNDEARDNLRCFRDSGSHCEASFSALIAAQYGLVLISLLLIWRLSLELFDQPLLAWITLIAAFVSFEYVSYAQKILTENLILPLFIGFQWALLRAYKIPTKANFAAIGLCLGLLTLTRPEYLYMASALLGATLIAWALRRNTKLIAQLFVALLVFCATLSPWSLRNLQQFDSAALVGGDYGETILAYRLSYNRMSVTEGLAAFIYWLPDFGDKLAEATLPESAYHRLVSANEDSFYATAVADILTPALAQMRADEVLPHWLKTKVFGDPITHGLVTLPFIWRGTFVAKYWGIIGLVAYASLLFATLKRRQYGLLVVSAPLWLMVVLHAGVSVNIPRYNLFLIALYAIGWANMVWAAFSRRWELRS